ncbi:MAG: putative Ig domain-containing protein [Sulfuritalea sp.]|nr:putative Ig domain-containing protein [Sulfuritalea sp.]
MTATDTFSYALSDADGGKAFTTLTITVTGVNDTPTSVAIGNVTKNDSETVSINTAGAFSDLDSNNVFTYGATSLPAGLTINSSGVISGTLASSASQVGGGVYSVIVTATDSAGAPTSQTFSITVANPAPVAQADTGAVAEDATLTVSAANGVIVSGAASGGVDSDIDGDTLSVIGVTTGTAASVAAVGTGNVGGSLTGTYGTLTLNADGGYSYVADQGAADGLGAGVTATDTFSYALSDADGGKAFTTLTITVTGVNDTPTSVAIGNVTKNDSETVSINTAGAFSDLDSNNVFTYGATSLPAGLTINSSGVISGTLASSASQVGGGVYSVIVTATDSAGAPTSQTFSITVANPAPVAQADTGAVAEDATLTVSAANGVIVSGAASGGVDSDIDGDTLSVIGVTTGTAASVAAVGTGNVGGSLTGTYGTLTLNADGGCSYVADQGAADGLGAGVTATDTFSYALSDADGGKAFTTLTITVTGVNDTPTSVAIGNVTKNDSETVSINTAGAFSDLDSNNVFTYGATIRRRVSPSTVLASSAARWPVPPRKSAAACIASS